MATTDVVIIGMGQMGGVFASGFLRAGRTVHPVLRGSDTARLAEEVPDPALALVAVGEAELAAVLGGLPAAWRCRVGLLQNELLPRDWLAHEIPRPTVAVVWFEKKTGRDVRVILPSLVYGPASGIVIDALERLEIPCRPVESKTRLTDELILKNLYILTANVTGLVAAGTVGELWTHHRALAVDVAREVLTIQAALSEFSPDAERMIERLGAAFEADPDHAAVGRTATARLDRALEQARRAGVDVPRLREIRADL